MPARGRSRNRDAPSRARRHQADQTSPSSRTSDRLQGRRRAILIAQHQQNSPVSEVAANMTDIARRTYPRNEVGPRAVDTRRSRRAPESPQRRRREPLTTFELENLGLRVPSSTQTNSRFNLHFAVTTSNPSHLRHVNPQALIAAVSLVDDRTGGPTPAGYLTSASSSTRFRPVQQVGPSFEIFFEDLLVKQPGTYQLKISLLRMPDASPTGGQATHVAEWESGAMRVQGLTNGV